MIKSRNILESPFPEMAKYQSMPATYPPYQMLAGPKNFRNAAISTSHQGYRRSLSGSKLEPMEKFYGAHRVNIVVGASTAFGVGASHDSATVSSCLHKHTGDTWINLGIRGAVSFQEYIALVQVITKFSSVDKIFFLSGINDLYRNLSDSELSEYDKRFDFENELLSHFSPRRIASCYLLSVLTRRNFNELLSGESPTEVAYDPDKSMQKYSRQYARNFQLYAALAKQFCCEITFGFQPFFHYAKDEGYGREAEAIKRSEMNQKNSNWCEVRDRITDRIEFASTLLQKEAEKNNIKYIDLNARFNENEELFVDSVHLTDLGYSRISEVICGIG